MTARDVLASAPLGATVHFSDGQPRPPERFRRKLAAWERSNGSGLLTQKTAASQMGRHQSPAYFSLRTGIYGANGVVVIIVNKLFDENSQLSFRYESPPAGAVLVVTGEGEREELRHLAQNRAEASAWLQIHRYPDARMVQITEGGGSVELPVAA